MRIAMALDAYQTYTSGVTQYVSLLKSCLERRGQRVFVFTFERFPPPDPQDLTQIISPAFFSTQNYTWGMAYTPSARHSLNTMDVVHVHHPFVSGPLVNRYTRGRIPIIFTNHTRYDLYLRAYLPWLPANVSDPLLFHVLRRYTDQVDQVIAPSPGMREVMKSWGLRAPISVVPNGIDLEPFKAPRGSIRRADLGIPAGDFLWIFVGRASPEKNLPFLLDAFAQVCRQNPHSSLLVVGDGPMLPELTAQAAALGIANQVIFAGFVRHELLPDYLRLADAFATASQTEVHPLTLIEAAASGLPVVGIRSTGVSDIVVPGCTGLLSSADRDEFAANMLKLSTQPALLHLMSISARRQAEQYSIETTTDHLLNLYTALQKRPGRETTPS